MAMAMPAERDRRVSQLAGSTIVTDRLDHTRPDQVLPLFDEQRFFLDELPRGTLDGARVLEIGAGSGVLSIALAKAGAARVTALEINPRAMDFAAFNIERNGVADRVELVPGDRSIYRPVWGRRFDYIISNPPFMPAPPGALYHLHSDAGWVGLDFVEAILRGLDGHLADGGRAQLVTGAPGGEDGPAHLCDLIRRRSPGAATVVVSPLRALFTDCAVRLKGGPDAAARMHELRRRAAQAGATHMYLCVVHLRKTPGPLEVRTAKQPYDLDRLLPAVEGPR